MQLVYTYILNNKPDRIENIKWEKIFSSYFQLNLHNLFTKKKQKNSKEKFKVISMMAYITAGKK